MRQKCFRFSKAHHRHLPFWTVCGGSLICNILGHSMEQITDQFDHGQLRNFIAQPQRLKRLSMSQSATLRLPIATPKAVLFDLDNTLTHRGLSIECYAQRFLCEFNDALRDHQPHQVIRLIKNTDNGGYLPTGSVFSSIREAIGTTLSRHLPWQSPKTPEELIAHWRVHFPAASVEMPGASALIKKLRQRGIACGVVSNGAEHSRRRTLDALPCGDAMQVLISSEAFGASKPDTAIFLAGAEQLGVAPEHCWFVGDHPINDYQGANAAGLLAVWLRGFHHWPMNLAPATLAIDTLEALPLLFADGHRTTP